MIIRTTLFLIILTFSFNSYSNTNISHAIAMHGEPKYGKDFLNVEYIDVKAIKGGPSSECKEAITLVFPLAASIKGFRTSA